MNHETTRRDFVKTSAAAGATWWMGSQFGYSTEKERFKIEQINFGCIGVGGKGSSDTDSAGRNGNVVALCDIDSNRLKQKAKKYPHAKKFADYRKMLEEMGDKIDAVTVTTPDHSHAPASLRAMRLGKHCFTQKPLTWSVEEARMMRKVAKEKKLATQMGNQGTSERLLREAVDMIRAGVIGDVTEVHVWTNRPIWPQGTGRPTKEEKIPANVNWDLFLGPAQYRPYSSDYTPFKWRGWVDYGTGALGDMGCHIMNLPVMALNLYDPVAIQGTSAGIFQNETYPKNSVVKYEFPKRASFVPCTMTWYDGGNKPPVKLMSQLSNVTRGGSLMVGTKGMLFSAGDYGGQRNDFIPAEKFKKVEYEKKLPRSPGHFKEYAIAIKGGPAAMSNFDYSSRLAETVILGNLALRTNERIEWDAKKGKSKNMPVLNKFVARQHYRDGFGIQDT